MKHLKKIIGVIAGVVLLTCFVAIPAMATLPTPCAFSGDVTLDGAACPGSIITVQLEDGTPVVTMPAEVVVTVDSTHGVMIPQDPDTSKPAQGDTLKFYVDGHLATTTGDMSTWAQGGLKTLNLAASTEEDGEEPTPEECLESIVDELVIVYYYASFGAWDVYWPAFSLDTIGTLEAGEIYMIYVESACTIAYGTHTYELNGPDWNYVYWQGA